MPTIASELTRESTRRHTKSRTLRRSFVVNLEHGLHARPCALLIKTLSPFQADVVVESEGMQVSGRSILGLMLLAAHFGSTVTFTITGDDAPEAMNAIDNVFATDFAEAYGQATRSRTKSAL